MRIEIRSLAVVAVMAMGISACGPEGIEPVQDTAAHTDAQILAEGKTAWRSCAKCHCATDLRIPEDEDWVVLNEETTCIEAGKPAPRLRKSIMAYLRHPDTLRPVLVTPDFKNAEGWKSGKILVPAIGGSAYLRADRASIKAGSPAMVRLYWGETREEKSLIAPAGRYKMINFWLYRNRGKQEEKRWTVTGTNVDGCTELSIDPQTEDTLDLDAVLYGDFLARLEGGKYALSFSIHDIAGNRMTLSRNGRVVMPGYRILDDGGKTVAEGRFAVI